jgi:hypothetical protein
MGVRAVGECFGEENPWEYVYVYVYICMYIYILLVFIKNSVYLCNDLFVQN